MKNSVLITGHQDVDAAGDQISSKLLVFFSSLLLILLIASTGRTQDPPVQPAQAPSPEFDRSVATILAARCIECHSGKSPESGLDLQFEKAAFSGGDSGAAITPGNLKESLLWQRVVDDEMPPKHPLSDQEKQVLKQWIENGAKWGTSPIDRFAFSTDSRAGRDWWSLQPLSKVSPPELKPYRNGWDPAEWVRNDVDRFIIAKLQEKNLMPTAMAKPRTLIRRLYFDLIGLPPTPEQIRQFQSDPSEDAYQKIVEELLASKHYGERWGRHWLDVVRYGESDGFERNFPRKNAWHYRDWVINAFNEDLPYDQFVKMQLIGDLLEPGLTGDSATGFWVAGVHNTVVGGSDRMKKLARQDEIEEVLATVGQTFVGLTVNCARCHDHKFDPITQKEFYRMASAISGLGHGEKNSKSSVNLDQIKQLDQKLTKLNQQINQLNTLAREKVLEARKNGKAKPAQSPKPAAFWDFETDLNDRVTGLKSSSEGNARIEDGALVLDGNSFLVTQPWKKPIAEKTLEVLVQLDNLDQRGGGVISVETPNGVVFDSIVFGERDPRQWMAGSNGFVRTDSFQAPTESTAVNEPVLISLVYQTDGTIIGYRNGQPYGRSIRKSGLQKYEAEKTEFLFGLRHKPGGGGRFLKGKIYSAAFYDRALSPDEIAATAGDSSRYVPEKQLIQFLSPQQLKQRAEWMESRTLLLNEKQQFLAKANATVYTLKPGNGATTRILLRGDPDLADEVVSPGAIAAVPGVDADFPLPPQAPENQRRQRLADWITSKQNPLFARVIVNRIWHYHFGTGIVDTPNDFGFNGGRPSHPDLLEWLAGEFLENGQSQKQIHRFIVLSSTYRQAGYRNAQSEIKGGSNPVEVDSENRLLWKMTPRRLEAESIRDSMLVTAGKLNAQMGGPSFIDVSIVSNNGTTYYSPISKEGPEVFRRTVYRFNPRGGRSALLDTFDCPDPAATAPRRAVTTTPLQALSLLNNEFVLKMADGFAERIESEVGDQSEAQINLAWQLSIGRLPSKTEKNLASQFVAEHGLTALCRALFNISEFVVIE